MLSFALLAAPLAQGLLISTNGVAMESVMESGLDPDDLAKIAPPSSLDRPVLVPPADMRGGPADRAAARSPASLIERARTVQRHLDSGAGKAAHGDQPAQRLAPGHRADLAPDYRASGYFQPSSGEFQERAEAAVESAHELPYEVGSPRNGHNPNVFESSSVPAIDVPKWVEYSLEVGDTLTSFSSAKQDIKLLTQVLFNIYNGFYLDSNANDGEMDSNTLLLELLGWRGLCIEPRTYNYVTLWAKFRKAWLFLGALSPHENHTKIGYDDNGDVDMLSGHKVHAHPVKSFLSEMGGRKTIDFWSLRSGGYEAEVLNETLLHSGSFIEFGVILVKYDGRRASRGWERWAEHRSKDETEAIIFEVLHNASFKYIGGLDAYWINTVEPKFGFRDAVFVNPSYFISRNISMPTSVKGPPPPPLPSFSPESPWSGNSTWDSGFTHDEEVDKVVEYVQASRQDAAYVEPVPKANRIPNTLKLG
jgi:hypothetical protein